MSNWRTELKNFFEIKTVEALGDEIKRFEAWNNQMQRFENEETAPEIAVYFAYSNIGDGREYLNQQKIQQAEQIPVTIDLRIVFNNYNGNAQNTAYDFADRIHKKFSGVKHDCINGRVLKMGEREDLNHAANYEYLMNYSFIVKEFVENTNIVDANEGNVLKPIVLGKIAKVEINT